MSIMLFNVVLYGFVVSVGVAFPSSTVESARLNHVSFGPFLQQQLAQHKFPKAFRTSEATFPDIITPQQLSQELVQHPSNYMKMDPSVSPVIHLSNTSSLATTHNTSSLTTITPFKYPYTSMYTLNSNVLRPKVLIIGAGLCGLAAGRRLDKYGFKVTIIEQEAFYGGCTLHMYRDKS